MAQITKPEIITHTDVNELPAEQLEENQTEESIEIPSDVLGGEGALHISALDLGTATSITGETERERSMQSTRVSLPDEASKRNERARANALMDSECLHFLRLFSKNKYFHIDELNEHVKQTSDWLKIALLVRADYLETLNSTIRITPEGQAAWQQLGRLRNLRSNEA